MRRGPADHPELNRKCGVEACAVESLRTRPFFVLAPYGQPVECTECTTPSTYMRAARTVCSFAAPKCYARKATSGPRSLNTPQGGLFFHSFAVNRLCRPFGVLCGTKLK